ncbi:MAG TPA: ribonuclease III [Bryobacteraceae bacterium]|nr:ribonuclease III [Bryobacteraceae bacterium]
MGADLRELEAKLGYEFRDRDLLSRALTHRSYSSESRPGHFQPDNEQLEFFGDSILGFIISDELVKRHQAHGEGRLSRSRSQMVSARWLHRVAEEIGLGDYLRLGRGEEHSGGRTKLNLLADALEALIAALYLDGGMDAARRFVLEHVWSDTLASTVEHTNYKGMLWERAGAEKLVPPQYRVVETSGPAHLPRFTVEVSLGDRTARGEGATKKDAEQEAARALMEGWPVAP